MDQTRSELYENDAAEQNKKIVLYYDLPWEECPVEEARQLTKDVYALGVDEEALLRQKEELEYEFDFDIDHYIILAQIMLKLDLNLKKIRHELVPEMITEEDFWRNYFYKIELRKKELNLTNKLGMSISRQERAQKMREKQTEAQLADEEDAIQIPAAGADIELTDISKAQESKKDEAEVDTTRTVASVDESSEAALGNEETI